MRPSCVFATLASTLEPTVDLIERKPMRPGNESKSTLCWVEGAYAALMEGHKDVHDAKIKALVERYLPESDVAVLAQASMASAVTLDRGRRKRRF